MNPLRKGTEQCTYRFENVTSRNSKCSSLPNWQNKCFDALLCRLLMLVRHQLTVTLATPFTSSCTARLRNHPMRFQVEGIRENKSQESYCKPQTKREKRKGYPLLSSHSYTETPMFTIHVCRSSSRVSLFCESWFRRHAPPILGNRQHVSPRQKHMLAAYKPGKQCYVLHGM